MSHDASDEKQSTPPSNINNTTIPSSSSSTVPLTESPNSVATEQSERSDTPPDGSETTSPTNPTSFVIVPPDQYSFHRQQANPPAPGFHPYTRPLTISDWESVVALENASFSNPAERASPEKIKYRLSKCGEICYGLFCTVVPGSDVKAATLETGRVVETNRRNGAISVLIGHVISAKASSDVVTDEAMDYPKDWASTTSHSPLGHQEHGRTIALHSVAILPEFQGRGLGRILMLSYMQNMNGAGIADRLALIAHDHKVAWYEKLGWTMKGQSTAQFGGGGWFDMIFDLKPVEFRTAYG